MDYCNRHVCLKDLENYLKKNEYLGGYTPVEQQQIRKNIGAIGETDLDSYLTEGKYIELTYSELQDLIKDKKLGIGQVYAIKDFQTIYQSNVQISAGVYQSWGGEINPSKVFKIITLALTPDSLYNRVIVQSEDYPDAYKWIVEYDYEQETLTDGIKTKGKITYLKDSNNNIAYYDFKNIKSRRTRSQLLQLGIVTDRITQIYIPLIHRIQMRPQSHLMYIIIILSPELRIMYSLEMSAIIMCLKEALEIIPLFLLVIIISFSSILLITTSNSKLYI